MILATSRFWNPQVNQPGNVVVRITLYPPRGMKVDHCIMDLAPTAKIFKVESDEEFTELYTDRLEQLGVDRIEKQLWTIAQAEPGQTLVLCCFERVLDPDNEWIPGVLCHRRIFAEWWQGRTGIEVPELPDTGPMKTTKPEPKPPPLLLF